MKEISRDLGVLQKFLAKVGDIPENAGFLILDFRKHYDIRSDGRISVSANDLLEPDIISLDYQKLLSAGFPWINLSCYGLYNNYLIAVVETPRRSTNARKTSINFSGPCMASAIDRWNVNAVMHIINSE